MRNGLLFHDQHPTSSSAQPGPPDSAIGCKTDLLPPPLSSDMKEEYGQKEEALRQQQCPPNTYRKGRKFSIEQCHDPQHEPASLLDGGGLARPVTPGPPLVITLQPSAQTDSISVIEPPAAAADGSWDLTGTVDQGLEYSSCAERRLSGEIRLLESVPAHQGEYLLDLIDYDDTGVGRLSGEICLLESLPAHQGEYLLDPIDYDDTGVETQAASAGWMPDCTFPSSSFAILAARVRNTLGLVF